jgi:hypothetical protein
MACGGCTRRKQKIKEIWHKHKRPALPQGEVRGGIGQKIVSTGAIQGRVHVARR